MDEPSIKPSEPEREFHPLADVFPMMSDAELAKLADDIKANGLRQPITLDEEGRILDGRHRYRACKMAGVEPHFEDFAGGDPLTFVVSLNVNRRHMNESQRAMVAGRLANLPRGANQHSKEGPQICASLAAQLLNVSPRTVDMAKALLRDSTAETIAAVDTGKLKVGRAYAETKAKVAGTPGIAMKHVEVNAMSAIVDAPADVIFVYPPWDADGPTSKWPTLTSEVVDKLGSMVKAAAAGDCQLFMWAPPTRIVEVLRFIEQIGFRCELQMGWPDQDGSRPGAEFAIFARKGQPRLIDIATLGDGDTASRVIEGAELRARIFSRGFANEIGTANRETLDRRPAYAGRSLGEAIGQNPKDGIDS
jgi:hypothetical protein